MKSSTVETREAVAVRVEVSDDTLSVELADGRTIAAPWRGIRVWRTPRPRNGSPGA